MKKEKPIVGLDIGTTKICAIAGLKSPNGDIEIIGVGTSPSHGLRKGVVVNIDSTVESIRSAVKEVELMAGISVDSVYAGIAGGHITSMNSRGIVAISGPDHEVNQSDIDRVIDAARAVSIPMDREVIHALVNEYVIDNQDGIKAPLGMSGIRLEADVHIVTGAVTSVQNIIKSVCNSGYNVIDIVLEQVASAEATLTEDEKYLGTVLIDIGGGTTDLALFAKGSTCYTSVLSIGGNHFTHDISVGFRTPLAEAERIKIKYGCALGSLIEEDTEVEVPSVGGRQSRTLSRKVLSDIIEPRAEEIFCLIDDGIRNSKYRSMIGGGVVLTGGTVILEGMPELAEQVLGLPVRRGIPQKVGGLVDMINSPKFATAVGLLRYGFDYKEEGKIDKYHGTHAFDSIFQRMKEWFKDFF